MLNFSKNKQPEYSKRSVEALNSCTIFNSFNLRSDQDSLFIWLKKEWYSLLIGSAKSTIIFQAIY